MNKFVVTITLIMVIFSFGCSTQNNKHATKPATAPTQEPTQYPAPEIDNQLYGDYSEVRPVATPTPSGGSKK